MMMWSLARRLSLAGALVTVAWGALLLAMKY